MRNTDKLIASQYLVKRANLGEAIFKNKVLAQSQGAYKEAATSALTNETARNLQQFKTDRSKNLSPLQVLNTFMPKGYEFGQESPVSTSPIADKFRDSSGRVNTQLYARAQGRTPVSTSPIADLYRDSSGRVDTDLYARVQNRIPATRAISPVDTNSPDVAYANTSDTDPAPAFVSSPTENNSNAVPLTAKDPSQFFKSYMGSNFDPKSRVDRNKLKLLQDLQDKGINLEDVKGNQAAIYKRMKGMKF